MPNCEKVDFDVVGAFGEHRVKCAVTAKNLKLPTQTISNELVKNLNIQVDAYYRAQVKILIGQDNWRLIVTRDFQEVVGTDLVISRSLLGWALHGTARHVSKQAHVPPDVASAHTCTNSDASRESDTFETEISLDDLIKQYFEIESIGINIHAKKRSGQERALKILEQTSRKTGKFWETGLLWRSDIPPNVDGYWTARARLMLTERRLDREPAYAQMYYKEVQRFIDLGYAVKADLSIERPRVWYLPHFGAYNVNKPNKIRFILDAAAKTKTKTKNNEKKNLSLNDLLEAGPDLLKSLLGILIRFRQYKVAVISDISDMFLRVKVIEQDRGAQRFLWRGKDRQREPDVYEMTTLIFGAKSSPCNAIYIKNINAQQFAESNPDASRSIIDDSYMDDFLTSRKTESEAVNLVRDVIMINSEAGFEMHGWASNNPAILQKATNHEQSEDGQEMRLCDRGGERVLGLFWDPRADVLRFNVEFAKISNRILNGDKKPTKREVLRVVMSVFDPLGLLAPFTLKSKLLMQEIWRSGVNWDDEIRDEEFATWLSWIDKLKDIKECQVPRCFSPINAQDSEAELHVFCDASITAYAAAAYLRFSSDNERAHVSLITSKSRVAPLKPLSIPRLELQAALIGARLAKLVESELNIKISRRVFWSDSATVICWIRSEPRTRQMFVAHRLGEIAELTQISEWRWVPSAQNPADDATRCAKDTLRSDDRWFWGPEFLSHAENQWPVERALNKEQKASINELELRKTVALVTTTTITQSELPLKTRLAGWRGLLVHARRARNVFDSWRVYRRTKNDKRKRDKRKRRAREKQVAQRSPLEIIQESENYWYRVIQNECFAPEIRALTKGKEVSKNSKIANLRPYLDECGILRANGRATLAHSEGFNNRPIILDSKHFASKMLIIEYHRKYYHGSKETVMNELRQKYHIVGLRNCLRSLISKCVICRLRRGRPQNPLMSALPAGRLAFQARPFSHCGVDYFGPMEVKIGRRREKRWGVLFTCLTTRAIHLELAHSLSTSSAIMALQRLAARRGAPLIVYSDNGTNFRGASKELKNEIAAIDNAKIAGTALTRRIEWRFNPPDAPHMGGAWERMIRSVKTALYAILREHAPSEEVLLTVFAEVEHSVNSRPLTHVSLDPRDEEALTPNHFLIGSSCGELKLGKYDAKNICLRKQYKLAQSFADAFWKRWIREYLPNLIPRQKWTHAEDPLKIGDVVLIVDLQAARNTWRKGTITRVFPGADSAVRMAEIHTPMGTMMRPTRKLVKLLGVDEVQN